LENSGATIQMTKLNRNRVYIISLACDTNKDKNYPKFFPHVSYHCNDLILYTTHVTWPSVKNHAIPYKF